MRPDAERTSAASSRNIATCIHAFGDDALGNDDAVGVAQRIRSGEITAREAVEAAIERAHRVNPVLNAIALENFANASTSADNRPAGVFGGVPTFVKDNTDVRGLPTWHGSQAVNPQPAKADAPFAKQLLSLGLIFLGKSRMPEFGLNATTEFAGAPPVRNPWHIDHSPGASSGGAAALVAAGVVPLAHANDGGGSTRIPAACCGLIGLKPTRGRLLEPESQRHLPVRLVTEGVVTRSVRDTAQFYAAAESHYRNRRLPEIGLVEGPTQRRLRVGMLMDSVSGQPTDDPTRRVVQATAQLLAGMGHRVEEMAMPLQATFADDFGIYWGMLSFLLGMFGKYVLSPDFDSSKLDNLTQGLGHHFRRNFWRAPAVILRLRNSIHAYAEIFESYDIVLSPVLAHTPPRLGYLSPELSFEVLFDRLRRYVAFTPLNNITGGPGLSLPMGTSAEGVPIAAHFSAKHGDERTLLELAFEIEAAHPWPRIQDRV